MVGNYFLWCGSNALRPNGGEVGDWFDSILNKQQVLDRLPQVRSIGLRGGVQYWDGQFDDARLALEIARTAQQKVLSY